MNENKKIIILSIIVILLFGLCIYFTFFDNKNTNNKEVETEEIA